VEAQVQEIEEVLKNYIFHFEVPAYDIGRLRRFYTQLFGWKIEKGGPGPMEYWNIETVPVDEKGMLMRPVNGSMIKRVGPFHKPVNYIAVESVDECCRKIEELDGKVIDPKQEFPGIGWWALLSDPEGNEFGIFESI